MERDLAGAFTKSSTSESLSSCSDLSLEEHVNTITSDSMPLEKAIPYLVKHQPFTYFNSKIEDIQENRQSLYISDESASLRNT